jgi:hypothetical protein
VYIVQELLPTGLEKRVRYCLWLQRLVGEHPGILDITWFTDEAWFHLSGYINSWCALSRRRNIGPIFLDQIVTTEVYLNIFSEFVNQLIADELTEVYFQQDGAKCPTLLHA